MKVTAFVGSARKKHTYHATELFMKNLQSFGDIDCEIVRLNDYKIEICRGCKLCLDKGEELCPIKDDRDRLIEKIVDSDGVVFASPNYSFQVSGIMKVFLDRLGFIFHRPRFFGKTFTSIVVQGVYGGKKINEYLDFVGKGLGFEVVKGCSLNSMEPMTEKEQENFDSVIYRQSRKFYSSLMKKEYPAPTLFELMVFRMARTSISLVLDESWRDYQYYRKKGWFKTDYYYPARLNPFKKTAGKLFDFLFRRIYAKKAVKVSVPDS
jgi:multimeric flavodoxin WrbA